MLNERPLILCKFLFANISCLCERTPTFLPAPEGRLSGPAHPFRGPAFSLSAQAGIKCEKGLTNREKVSILNGQAGPEQLNTGY